MATRVPGYISRRRDPYMDGTRILTADRVRKRRETLKKQRAEMAKAILSDEEVLQRMRLQQEDIDQLLRISRGEGGRNQMAQMIALKMRHEAVTKAPLGGVGGGVEVVVRTVGGRAAEKPADAPVAAVTATFTTAVEDE